MADFSRALEKGFPPVVGDVRLSFDSPVLVGESVRQPLPAVSVALAALSAALLVLAIVGVAATPPSPVAALLCAGVGAVALAASVVRERRAHGRRAFVIDFNAHTVRLDAPTRWGAPQTRFFAFTDVCELSLRQMENAALALSLKWKVRSVGEEREAEHVEERDLIRDVNPSKATDLHRVKDLLSAALAL